MSVACGGSVSLYECGVIDLLKNGKYSFLNREDIPADKMKKYFRDCFSVDTYLSSANAITEAGEIYNVDGNSNRVAAICYGPDKVILVVGYNKIVKNLDEAITRVKKVASPDNCKVT